MKTKEKQKQVKGKCFQVSNNLSINWFYAEATWSSGM